MENRRGYGTVRLMSVILSISSQVVRGHVGNSAIVYGLRAFGHEVWPVPTVVLSNHPGHGAAAGVDIAPADLEAMIGQLEQQGWLSACDAVLTGYFRSAAQCQIAANVIRDLKSANPNLIYCCDPVLGDDPDGLYVDAAIAEAVHDQLLPLADLATPNRFELSWLSGAEVGDAVQAVMASRLLKVADVVATSIPEEGATLATVWTDSADAVMARVHLRETAQHGIGDLLAGLVLARKLAGDTKRAAAGLVTAIGEHVLDASSGRDELDLVAGLSGLDEVTSVEVFPVRE